MEFIQWLSGQPASVASFLGTLTGSLLGLLAILGGALFNARLNRRRDDRLRNEDAQALRSALIGELTGLRDAFETMSDNVANDTEGAGQPRVYLPDIAYGEHVFPVLLPKLGLLPSELVRQVIDTYIVLRQFNDRLRLLGAEDAPQPHFRGFIIAGSLSKDVAIMGRNTARKINGTIAALKLASG